jgi:hypothetical protein
VNDISQPIAQLISSSVIVRKLNSQNRSVAPPVPAQRIASSTGATLQLALSPNPASSTVNVFYELLENATVTLEVLNILNQQVQNPLSYVQQNAGTQNISLDVSRLQSGTYMVRLIAYSVQGTFLQTTIPLQIVR